MKSTIYVKSAIYSSVALLVPLCWQRQSATQSGLKVEDSAAHAAPCETGSSRRGDPGLQMGMPQHSRFAVLDTDTAPRNDPSSQVLSAVNGSGPSSSSSDSRVKLSLSAL